MARKVFISFLGISNYVNCRYSFDDGEISVPVRFVQEAIIRRLCKEWSEDDIIYIFCTTKEKSITSGTKPPKDGSKELNWVDNGQKKTTEEIEKIGLETRLRNLRNSNILKAHFEEVDIEAGFSENEIWDIFDTVYQKLRSSDEIYFDVTHAFRSIPMFSIVLFNHAKFMKSTGLKAVYYGAFEKLGYSNEVKLLYPSVENRIAPIIDLTNIAMLQEYNQIASGLKYFGKVKALGHLVSQTSSDKTMAPVKQLADAINQIDEYITTIDLNNLRKGKFVTGFINNYKFLKRKKVMPRPIENVLDELYELMSSFENKDSYKNIEAAIKWTIKYDMLMQSYPLAAEYVKMRVADYFIKLRPEKMVNKDYREFIGGILGAPEDKFINREWDDFVNKHKDTANIIADNPIINNLRPLYDRIRGYRNSLAHGNGSVTFQELKDNTFIIDQCISIIDGRTIEDKKDEKYSLFLNLSNHPSSHWSEEQFAAAREYGEIKDIPFPAVDENLDEEGIDALADEYFEKIKEVSDFIPCTVHIMGEMTFTYALVNKLKEAGYTPVASTSWRDVQIQEDGSKQVKFHFCRFRKY